MHVAVAIVSYRNPKDVVACLAALTISTQVNFEVIICENGGDDAFRLLTEELPAKLAGGQPVRAVSAPDNPGFAGGVNICLAETPDADAWWVLNPDTEPKPDAMAAMVRRISHGDCDAVGSTLVDPTGFVQSYGGLWRTWFGRSVSIGVYKSRTAEVDSGWVERTQNYIIGASMMVSRHFVEVIGPMREDYFLYCEEVEWSQRGTRGGLKLGFAADAQVVHHRGTTTGGGGAIKKRSRLSVYLGSRNTILMTRDLFPWRLPTATLAVVAAAILVYGRRGAWAQAGYHLSGTIAGLTNERGVPKWMRQNRQVQLPLS